jgi:hypothetical protein
MRRTVITLSVLSIVLLPVRALLLLLAIGPVSAIRAVAEEGSLRLASSS